MSRFEWERSVLASGVGANARLVAFVLATHWPRVEPSVARLVELSRLSRSSVLRALAELEATGLISVEREHGKRSLYRCHTDTGVTRTPVSHGHRCHTDTATGVTLTPEETKKRQDTYVDDRAASVGKIVGLLDRHTPWWCRPGAQPSSRAIAVLREIAERGTPIEKIESILLTISALGEKGCRYPVGALAGQIDRPARRVEREVDADVSLFKAREADHELVLFEPLTFEEE